MAAGSGAGPSEGDEPSHEVASSSESSAVSIESHVENYASQPVAPPRSPAPRNYPTSPPAPFASSASATTGAEEITELEWVEELPSPSPRGYSSEVTSSPLPRLPMKRKYPAMVIIAYCFRVMACIIAALLILALLLAFFRYITADNPLEKAAEWMELRIVLLASPFVFVFCVSLWALAELIFMLIHFEENVRAIGIGVIEICKKYRS
jgi:hypothetical protein